MAKPPGFKSLPTSESRYATKTFFSIFFFPSCLFFLLSGAGSLSNSGCPQTRGNPPASASQLLGLQAIQSIPTFNTLSVEEIIWEKKRFTIKSRTQASKNFYAELRGQELCPGCQSLGEAASLWNADGMVYEVEVSSGERFKETKAGWVANSPQDILALKCNSWN